MTTDRARLELAGDVSGGTATVVAELLHAVTGNRHVRVEIDLRAVGVLDPAGVRAIALAAGWVRRADGRLVVWCRDAGMLRELQRLGVSETVPSPGETTRSNGTVG